MTGNWVSTDEAEDVAGSLRHAVRSAEFVGTDPVAYKWILLALHSALQGACVCHLTTTAPPLGAITKCNTTEWLTYFRERRSNPDVKCPRTFLMPLPDLLKAVRKPQSAGDRSNADGVKISDAELNWLSSIHGEIRNQFVHFEPRSWSIDVSGIPDLSKLVARIIEEILKMGWAFRHQSPNSRNDLEHSLETLSKLEGLLNPK